MYKKTKGKSGYFSMFILLIFLKSKTKLCLRLNSLSFLVLGEQRLTMMCYTGCPRTPSPEKKENICVNVIIWILKKKVLSQAIIEKRQDQSELSTIKVGGPQFCVVGIWDFVVISRRASGIGQIENYSYRKFYFSHLGVSFAVGTCTVVSIWL
jgi:hypothetical protein